MTPAGRPASADDVDVPRETWAWLGYGRGGARSLVAIGTGLLVLWIDAPGLSVTWLLCTTAAAVGSSRWALTWAELGGRPPRPW